MSHTPEDRIREEQVRRLSTDEDPSGGQRRDDVYPADLKPKKAKTPDRDKEAYPYRRRRRGPGGHRAARAAVLVATFLRI
jgi:hypothetical protein